MRYKYVLTMYLDQSYSKQNGKIYKRYLLRESYREGKKVKHRTIANLSKCSDSEIAAIRLALQHKKDLTKLTEKKENYITQKQGLSVGSVWLIYDIAKQLGIVKAFGTTEEGKLGLWQVIARVIDQGSRLSAVRLAGYHGACDILGLKKFDEDDLYRNLDWLTENQELIENRLFNNIYRQDKPSLFLYDVTSSYFEGKHNELSAFGYNRDGKRGKKQIVIGLLCNEAGIPLSVEVFVGNTQDPMTFTSQIRKSTERFGSVDVTFVGDRGMIKGKQVEELYKEGFHYITAITKPQIEKLLKEEVFQLELFDTDVAEVKTIEGIRYILRRNPIRAKEIRESRLEKVGRLKKEIDKRNQYLKEHPRATSKVAINKVKGLSKRLKISDWALVTLTKREIKLGEEKDILIEDEKLDGCYVLKTDLSDIVATKEIVHNRYKDLALVESAFRTSKTVELEMRPIHVRLATRTRGHAFVVMVAYRIVQELSKRWEKLNLTVQEGIDELSSFCATELTINGVGQVNNIPEPRESVKTLLDSANVRLPKCLPCSGVNVTTRKKLSTSRKNA